jgi:hypothetical protein
MATVRIQVRRGTSTQWTSTNPILAAGEMGVETNTNLFKFGNGTATWTALSYANNSDVAIGEISQDAINAALTMGTGLTKTYNDGANTITIAIDDTVWANKSYVTSAISSLSNTVDSTYIPLDDRGSANGVASLNAQGKVPTSETDLTVMATRAYAEYLQTQDLTALLAHESDTTNIHGIANTANLVTSATLATEKADAISQAATSRDTAISTAIATEVTSRTAAIASEATSRTAAIASEATSRTAAIASEATSRTTALANEATARATLETTLQGYADGAVSTHSTDTTNVHGIADTLLLATTANVATAKSEAISAAATAADSALGTHTADTTNVHGITDTSLLATTANVATAKSEAIAAAGTAADTKVSTAVAALTKSSVGLPNVDNTADTAKPVSTAQATAIATAKSEAIADATSQVNALLTGAPSALNTLDELAAALGDDANFASTVTTSLGLKAPLASPTFTGTVTLPAAGIVFSDGTQAKAGVPSITTFGSSFAASATLAAGEQDKFVPVAGTVVITLPASGYSTGQSIDFYQASGTGASFASTNSVVGTPGLKFRTTNSVVTAMKTAAGWLIFGDLSA